MMNFTLFDYNILWELQGFGVFWYPGTLAKQLGVETKSVAQSLGRLAAAGLVRQTGLGYQITDEGVDELEAAKKHPDLTQEAHAWINLVRAGIDDKGKETQVINAAIPGRISPEMSYTPQLEELVDALERELDDYLD